MDPAKVSAVVDWNSQADLAFWRLRKSFKLAAMLILPDTSRQFVVEVDASDLGIGAILYQ